MATYLIGGGWLPRAAPLVYGPFLADAGTDPAIACVVLDEGDGATEFERWASVLRGLAPCRPVAVLVPLGGRLDVASLADTDAVLVCGGLTPGYADALVPSAADLRAWLGRRGIPYAGFSAGSAVAASNAVVGGWICDGVQVCPEDSAEDLDEVTVRDGLGLVPFTVDVHAAQWGTLPRLIAAVDIRAVGHGVAIDENTAVIVDGNEATVAGLGRVYSVRADGQAMLLHSYRSGDRFSVASGQGDD